MRQGESSVDHLIEVLLPRGSGRRDAARRAKAVARKIVRRLRPDRSAHIFVACFQKSGSSYLTEVLSEITGFESRAIVAAYGHNEQDVSRSVLEQLAYRNSVSQQHARGTDNNVALLNEFNVKPIVLVRDIFDVVVSLYDHIEKGRHRVPTGYVHREYFGMSEDEKLLYIIRIHLPWYFNFLVSWRDAAGRIDVCWLTYEELFSDQPSAVARVLDFYDLPTAPAKIREAIAAATAKRRSVEVIRFNVGIAGRGQRLSSRHKQAILDIAGVWKIDEKTLRKVGIPLVGGRAPAGSNR